MNNEMELVTNPQAENRIYREVAAVDHAPVSLLRVALERGADLATLERLQAMHVQEEERAAKRAYNAAFAAFKGEAVIIIKNRSVTQGPLSGKKYAELFAVVNAATPALSKHGLSASWRLTKDDKDWLEVTCTLKHSQGYSESVSMGGPPDAGGAKSAIQARASTVTYLERYTLKAILGLSEQEDDNDGGGFGPGDIPEDALAAANEGMLMYQAYWVKLKHDQKKALEPHHPKLKEYAQAADRSGK